MSVTVIHPPDKKTGGKPPVYSPSYFRLHVRWLQLELFRVVLQTQQADSVAYDTDDEEANDDPQWVNFLTQ